jgi:hypothetical protein
MMLINNDININSATLQLITFFTTATSLTPKHLQQIHIDIVKQFVEKHVGIFHTETLK